MTKADLNTKNNRSVQLILALVRKVRNIESQVVSRQVTGATLVRFQAVALIMRQERTRIKADPNLDEAFRLELLKRLDGLAAVMVRIAVRNSALMAIFSPDATVSEATEQYRRKLLLEIGIELDPDEVLIPITAPAAPPERKGATPKEVERFHALRPFKLPDFGGKDEELVPVIRLANWDLLSSMFKSFAAGGDAVCKQLPKPVPFLERVTPPGLEMMAHQSGFVEAARLGHRNFLLADEPGLGKTAQSLLAASITGSFPLLVVVPNVVKMNWAREVSMWLPGRRATVIHGDGEDIDAFADVFIVNYDILDRHVGWMSEFGFAGMVVDEAHFIKNFSSQRSANVLALSKAIRASHPNPLMIALTGTPVINSVEDFRAIWLFLGWLSSEKQLSPFLVSELEKTGLTPADPGFSAAVRSLMGELGIVRRRKIDVAKDLPSRRIADLPVELDDEAGKSIRRAEKELADSLYQRYLVIKGSDEQERRLRAVNYFTKEISDGKKANIFGLLRQLGILKAPLAADFALHMLDSVDKLVFFAKHVEVMDTAERIFRQNNIGCVSIRGNQTSAERQQAIYAFDNDPKVRVVICSLTAAGVGLNLQVASNVILAELSWTAAEQDQAIDRLHRIGQSEPVTAWRILGSQTLDTRVAALIDSKASEASLSLDGGEATEEQSLQVRALLELLDARIRGEL